MSLQADFYEFLKLKKFNSKNLLIVTDSDKTSHQLLEVALFLGFNTHLLPDFKASYGDDLRSYKSELSELCASLCSIYEDKKDKIVISPLSTVSKKLPLPKHFKSQKIEFGQKLKLAEFKKTLLFWGYEFVDIVQSEGEVSIRGDIIDIFLPSCELPFRVCLFDEDVESIRHFDTDTQRTTPDELESLTLRPAFLALEEAEYEQLGERARLSTFDTFFKDINSVGFWLLDEKDSMLQKFESYLQKDFLAEIEDIYLDGLEALTDKEAFSLPLLPHAMQYQPHQAIDIKNAIEFNAGKKLTIIAKNELLLKQHELLSFAKQTVFSDACINLVSKDEFILSLNKPEKKSKKRKTTILLDELKPGDYIVHENYGVGIFESLEQVRVLGAVREFVRISYLGEDKLLLPVENLDRIDRYIGESGSLPSVDRLGKSSFGKLKESVKKKLFEIAAEIVDLAAKRELEEGVTIDVQKPELVKLRQDAGFTYTTDQVRSIEEVFADISSGRVMDRLLNGDVGFGKTEVAMNAALAVTLSDYQCFIIAPTTLLSRQHFANFSKRVLPYGIQVFRIDRFVSAKEKAEAANALKRGVPCVVIGTHSLLDLASPHLGLVVIDEEHKFGVKQKEKLKKLKEGVHVLSMSATPIPRTLNMALSSIKGMSEILTPPSEREGVRTFVKEYDEKVVKEAILREMRRGGQIFYIHNRIASINGVKKSLEELVPRLRVAVLHSQVDATETERELIAFAEKQYDLMLSTSIVESGIDMPNVNTIVIDGADNFGIADLHQLRGRVGRGNKEGYCYFLVESKDELTEEAKKRLIALESNSYLGSGAALAYHDLEIRGGGNILGDAQSGHIKGVGYSLYLKMLEETIAELSGKQTGKKSDVDIKLSVNAYISPEYIEQERVRLEIYRRLSSCKQKSEVYEIAEELHDRFGEEDTPTKQLLELMLIKIAAGERSIKLVSNYNQNITLTYEDERKEYLEAASRDDDDIIAAVLKKLK